MQYYFKINHEYVEKIPELYLSSECSQRLFTSVHYSKMCHRQFFNYIDHSIFVHTFFRGVISHRTQNIRTPKLNLTSCFIMLVDLCSISNSPHPHISFTLSRVKFSIFTCTVTVLTICLFDKKKIVQV